MIEAGAGAVILIIVAVLGTLPPGLEEQAKVQHEYDKLKQFSAQAMRDERGTQEMIEERDLKIGKSFAKR
jgi:hypothetical protein